MSNIAGAGNDKLSEEDFLNFVALELQTDANDVLREIFKVTSKITDTKPDSEELKPKTELGTGINYRDLLKLLHRLGSDMPEEEAQEMIIQAKRGDLEALEKEGGQINFDEMVRFLAVPPGGD